jgi:hypothetical protein
MSAHLAAIDCVAYLYVLQAHNGPDVRCLGNVRVRWEQVGLAAHAGLVGFSLWLGPRDPLGTIG